jgi:hypothetical protein
MLFPEVRIPMTSSCYVHQLQRVLDLAASIGSNVHFHEPRAEGRIQASRCSPAVLPSPFSPTPLPPSIRTPWKRPYHLLPAAVANLGAIVNSRRT